MILVDTSVWVQHLRSGSARLQALLSDDQVLCHPFVLGELACGNLRRRQEILALLAALPAAKMAEHHEVLHLLASALISRCRLWTLDRHLQRAAAALETAG